MIDRDVLQAQCDCLARAVLKAMATIDVLSHRCERADYRAEKAEERTAGLEVRMVALEVQLAARVLPIAPKREERRLAQVAVRGDRIDTAGLRDLVGLARRRAS